MKRLALALLALAAAPAWPEPARPEPVTIPFAPPLDAPLRYRTVQYRIVAGRTQSFTMTLSLRFSRDTGGVVLTIVTTAIAARTDPATRLLFEAGMQPFVGVPTRVRLDGDGCPADVIDGDATWARIVAAQESETRALVRTHGSAAGIAMMRGYYAAFAASPPAVRKTQLLAGARQFLCFSRTALAPGERRAWRDEAASPFGPSPSSGTITLADADAAQAHFVIATANADAATAAAAAALAARIGQAAATNARAALRRRLAAVRATRLTTRRDIRVSRATGLLLSATTVDGDTSPAGTVILSRETTRRLP